MSFWGRENMFGGLIATTFFYVFLASSLVLIDFERTPEVFHYAELIWLGLSVASLVIYLLLRSRRVLIWHLNNLISGPLSMSGFSFVGFFRLSSWFDPSNSRLLVALLLTAGIAVFYFQLNHYLLQLSRATKPPISSDSVMPLDVWIRWKKAAVENERVAIKNRLAWLLAIGPAIGIYLSRISTPESSYLFVLGLWGYFAFFFLVGSAFPVACALYLSDLEKSVNGTIIF